jgi:hypothetical protein
MLALFMEKMSFYFGREHANDDSCTMPESADHSDAETDDTVITIDPDDFGMDLEEQMFTDSNDSPPCSQNVTRVGCMQMKHSKFKAVRLVKCFLGVK